MGRNAYIFSCDLIESEKMYFNDIDVKHFTSKFQPICYLFNLKVHIFSTSFLNELKKKIQQICTKTSPQCVGPGRDDTFCAY